MSSHREAPETSKDPVVDNTDVYAFVSPDAPDTVTLIANFIPFQKPDGGPNFYEFGEDVLYEIHVSNKGTAQSDITYQFRFDTHVRNKKTFLYNTGPITELSDKTWNRPQYYSVTKVVDGKSTVLTSGQPSPPNNVGKRSTPNYTHLANAAVRTVGDRKFFAGQRAEGFHVDLGSIFDLGALRPFQMAHLIPSANTDGVNSLKTYNVHSIAIQVPIAELSRTGVAPVNPWSKNAVIGVWASASRRHSRIYNAATGRSTSQGDWVQVSRLANPLFNEVITPMADKDYWNASPPSNDKNFAAYVNKPELAALLPVLYPNTFPKLAAYTKPRADLNAILLTGIPKGIIDGFQNYTGPVEADMVRLNMVIPPAKNPNNLGVIGGDAAGFPNGRRVADDVVAIELRAIAGVTIPLVDKDYTPDNAAKGLSDGTEYDNPDYLAAFPYLGHPNGGYQTKPGSSGVS